MHTQVRQVIHIHEAAPRKPPEGSPCNGCGVCCLSAPCPLGIVLSGRQHGACAALRWDGAAKIYRCGAISEPREVLRATLPLFVRSFAPVVAPILGRVARRWVAAGIGCDSSLEVGLEEKSADEARVGQ